MKKLSVFLIASSMSVASALSSANTVIVNGKKYTCDGDIQVNNGTAICNGQEIQPDAAPQAKMKTRPKAMKAKTEVPSTAATTNTAPQILDTATLKKKTFAAINKVVREGDYPQKCIVKYTINSAETTTDGEPVDRKQAQEDLHAMMEQAKKDGLSADEIMVKLKEFKASLPSSGSGPVTKRQLTAKLKYKTSAGTQEDVIMDLEASAEGAKDLMSNMKDVAVSFRDRYCLANRVEQESPAPTQNTAAPISSKQGSGAQ
ncbi:hypothetical protein [Bdellovibrio sp. HCB209]|uniref:hypothetical protein n=1 Tax=Bdellovibrio sp. HCB209 TaxID=3394354 RepID=UPI0039B6393D